MGTSKANLAAGAAVVLLCAFVFGSTTGSQAQEPAPAYGVGIPDVFLRKYLAFRAAQLVSRTPHVLHVRLGYVKGLSRSFTSMAGEMTIDLDSGAFRVSLNGLTPLQTYGVWLVDRMERDDAQPVPDAAFRLATVAATGPSAVATGAVGALASALPPGFTIDRVVVTAGSQSPAAPVAAGTVSVFQRIFFRRLSLLNEGSGAVLLQETTPAPGLTTLVPDPVADADTSSLADSTTSPPVLDPATSTSTATAGTLSGGTLRLDRLISRGATLFFEHKFRGNGRTCGTCHPASNNFTIDPDFISTLPADDPLFVAEFNPSLAQLERPQLMRLHGLILENLDDLTNPTKKFVMRSVPHTLGLQVSMERDTSLATAPVHMIGWSGDGAPGSGSLREFALGAVVQHLTRNLERVAGRDFMPPTERQLDAMEAFQLSLGRSVDFDLSKITFTSADVNSGKSLFINGTRDPAAGGTCAFCHANAGALSINGQNRNFNSNVEDVLHPARFVQDYPKDGGFGQALNSGGTFGDHFFNTASVVEAADTAPFFHNNVVSTLEGVVDFYSGPEFNAPRAPAGRFNFSQAQRDQLADFMRGVNVLHNIDLVRRELGALLENRGNPLSEQDRRLRTAFVEAQDAIDVLNEGALFPNAVTRLVATQKLVRDALSASDAAQRRTLVRLAIARLDQARGAVATIAP